VLFDKLPPTIFFEKKNIYTVALEMIPQTFTVTSEHIRFSFLVFPVFFKTLFSCCFRAVD